jgi:hypothetical protein
VADALEKTVYPSVALMPAYPWLSQTAPSTPVLSARSERDELKLEWKSRDGSAWQWLVQKKIDGKWAAEILPEDKTSETVKANSLQAVAVTAVNRYGNISPPAVYRAGR